MVEGEEDLLIEANIIQANNEGVVLLHCSGTITKNRIQNNERSGLYLLSDTIALIEDNTIENNKLLGIDIRDPSMPNLRGNKIQDNIFQVKLDKNIRRKWESIKQDNPDILGENDFPKGISC